MWPYYEDDESVGLVYVSNVLKSYLVFNFDLGYVQGMNDLVSVFVMLFKNQVEAFWCFKSLMDEFVCFLVHLQPREEKTDKKRKKKDVEL